MLRSYINYQFKSTVWRLEIDPKTDNIFAEIRDQADKKVHFASLDLHTGKLFFDGLETEERWLTGIEAAFDGILLLHNYQSEAGPAHKGLIAIDGTTGKTLWSNYTHAFDHFSAQGPVIYDTRIQPRKLLLADLKTGALISPYTFSTDLEIENQLILPQITPFDFLDLPPLPIVPFGNTVHYLEHNNFRIVSLHTFADGALQQHLYIVNAVGIVYEDLLNMDIQKLQPESFLLHKDHLIYLKNKSQLKVLNL